MRTESLARAQQDDTRSGRGEEELVMAEDLKPNQILDDCPECGAKRIVRQNRKTGDLFIGCSAYPRCRQTWPIDDYHEAGDFSWKQ